MLMFLTMEILISNICSQTLELLKHLKGPVTKNDRQILHYLDEGNGRGGTSLLMPSQ